MDKMISELEFVGLRWTCRVRPNTEHNSSLLTAWKGSSEGVVADGFCVQAPVVLPAHLWRRRAQLERFQPRTCPCHGAAAVPGWAELQPRCHCLSTKERRALNLASWATARPNAAMPETLGKEAVCQTYGWNMLCSSHPRLAYGLPSPAASWALVYTGPDNQGPCGLPDGLSSSASLISDLQLVRACHFPCLASLQTDAEGYPSLL